MRKRVIGETPQAGVSEATDWLGPEHVAEVEVSSEDPAQPIESALVDDQGPGWRAASPGRQTIRLRFEPARRLERVRLVFVETGVARTQEYLLRWSSDGGRSYREIVRQQWNFNPQGSTSETETHRLDLAAVDVLELIITPDIAGGGAVASLAQLRVA